MRKQAILTTTYNRPPFVVEAAVKAARAALPTADLVICDDGSHAHHRAAYAILAEQYGPGVVCDAETILERPDAYQIPDDGSGINNPAHAFNVGLRVARERGAADVLILSSDTVIQSRAREQLRFFDTGAAVWTCSVCDTDSGGFYHAPNNVRPFPWAMYTSAEAIEACGAWDENYMGGIAFEDNDFSARISLWVGRLIVRGDIVAWHQSHPAPAYSDDLRGWRTNEAYTRSKWGGYVPYNERGIVSLRNLTNDPAVAAFRVSRSHDDYTDFLAEMSQGCETVVDLGCGAGSNFARLHPDVKRKVGVDAHAPYLKVGRENVTDPAVQFVHADIREFVKDCEPADCALLLDVVEHFDKPDALAVIEACKGKFRRIAINTPKGYVEQTHDAHGMGGEHWQTHRCGFDADELRALGFKVYEAWGLNEHKGKPAGALLAWWEAK